MSAAALPRRQKHRRQPQYVNGPRRPARRRRLSSAGNICYQAPETSTRGVRYAWWYGNGIDQKCIGCSIGGSVPICQFIGVKIKPEQGGISKGEIARETHGRLKRNVRPKYLARHSSSAMGGGWCWREAYRKALCAHAIRTTIGMLERRDVASGIANI